MRNNGGRSRVDYSVHGDVLYRDRCNLYFKVFGLITLVWGIIVTFGSAATIIGAGGPDLMSEGLLDTYTFGVVGGLVMFVCGLYNYNDRYTSVSMAGFLLSLVSASLGLIFMGFLAVNDSSKVALGIMPAIFCGIICYVNIRNVDR